MKHYLELKKVKVLGAPLALHWSAIVVFVLIIATYITKPLYALICAFSYFGLVLIHEMGHAFVARRTGYGVYGINISAIHGACIIDEPYREIDDIKIAWAGVLAQLIVAIPLVILAQFSVMSEIAYLEPVFIILGYFSLVLIVVNLIPIPGLDGETAWRIIPYLYKKRASKPKKKKHKYKVVK